MKPLILMLLLSLLIPYGRLSARHSLQKATTEPRAGDEYIKTDEEYAAEKILKL